MATFDITSFGLTVITLAPCVVLEWNFLYKRAAYAKSAPKTKKMHDKSQPEIDVLNFNILTAKNLKV